MHRVDKQLSMPPISKIFFKKYKMKILSDIKAFIIVLVVFFFFLGGMPRIVTS